MLEAPQVNVLLSSYKSEKIHKMRLLGKTPASSIFSGCAGSSTHSGGSVAVAKVKMQ